MKGVLVDEKNHIRFADWSANDVSDSFTSLASLVKYIYIYIFPILKMSRHNHNSCTSPDRSAQQIFVPHVEADYVFGESVGKGLHTQEEQMVSVQFVTVNDRIHRISSLYDPLGRNCEKFSL